MGGLRHVNDGAVSAAHGLDQVTGGISVTSLVNDEAALGELARAAGFRGRPADLIDFLEGVNAAPAACDPDRWLALLPVDLPAAVIADLARLKADVGAPRPDGDPPPDARIQALRAELARRELTGFVIPRADEHQGENLPARSERLRWLTGFSGSAGLAVVLADSAAIFVDGRYTLQVASEVDTDCFVVKHLVDDPHSDWVKANLPHGGRLGYDPWLQTVSWVEKLRRVAEEIGGDLVPVEDNPVDAIWASQPARPLAPVVPHDIVYAGRTSWDKRHALGDEMAGRGVDAAVITAAESIAWLLNIRGGDVPHTPLALCMALLAADGHVELFVDHRKLVPGLDRHLGNEVTALAPDSFGPSLDALGAEGKAVQADAACVSAWVFDRLHRAGATVRRETDPCTLPKARKNATELDGARKAHIRDGAAMCRFLAWLSDAASQGSLQESETAERLLAFRAEHPLFRGASFETISAAGPNAAIVHYRVRPETDRRLAPGTLYLVDSGAQYLDGTTDLTRTIAIGPVAAEMRRRFTLVLKGHIALATARFPRGTTGSQLDTLARQFLWAAGLDFDHGTGHGVGSYLCVHEGPHRISRAPNTVALEPGMILSNEPGYYKADSYGIRLENLIAVIPCPSLPEAERPMLAFETLTLVPFDRTLIDAAQLSGDEIAWFDAYHGRVRETLTPLVDEATALWLAAATRPLVSRAPEPVA
ncbi:MAG: M24 family metallopeptidase [Alphaproteobacteria bacterium]|jgi:Xaa-Pro aminopeptidase|nr:M24 family metallopeptidase [Alphaproteobacteria bacterium]